MSKLGFKTIQEMVGNCQVLKVDDSLRTFKTANLDLSPILTPAHTLRPNVATYCIKKQQHNLHTRLDNYLIDESDPAFVSKQRVKIESEIVNTDRAVGATLSYHVSKKFGEHGLPSDTIHVNFTGSAGQSFGAFLAPGIFFELEGDSNDYVGKGLSGGKIAIYPPKSSQFKAQENVIIGNVCLYGATSGQAFFSGIAAERFCVRNSGAMAVVEGVGDHGCEYMTGGRVAILGKTGRNFAAGMSGGIAYVLDQEQTFKNNVNMEMVDLETVNSDEETSELRSLIEDHLHYTGSDIASLILKDFNKWLPKFVKVMPIEYRNLLEKKKNETKEIKKCEQHIAEPQVEDVEDAVLDEETIQARRKKLDKLRGFMKYKRKTDPYRDPKKRSNDWKEINHRLSRQELHVQAARCMDCGVPYCQTETGCPIGNVIPKWNELVFKDNWRDALDRLLMTNNFPEFTGRVW